MLENIFWFRAFSCLFWDALWPGKKKKYLPYFLASLESTDRSE